MPHSPREIKRVHKALVCAFPATKFHKEEMSRINQIKADMVDPGMSEHSGTEKGDDALVLLRHVGFAFLSEPKLGEQIVNRIFLILLMRPNGKEQPRW